MKVVVLALLLWPVVCRASILPASSPPEAVAVAELADVAYAPAAKLDALLAPRGYALQAVVDRAGQPGGQLELAHSTFAFAALVTSDRPGLAKGTVVVAIRGSHTANDWFTNAHLKLCGWTGGAGRVHEGFLAVTRAVLAAPRMRALLATSPRLVITGHSLGGAAAVILAAHLVEQGRDPRTMRVFTFGAPKPGDDAFAQRYAACLDFTEYRLGHDPIFRLPESRPFCHLCDLRPEHFIPLERPGSWLLAHAVAPNDHHMWNYVYRMHGKDADVLAARGLSWLKR